MSSDRVPPELEVLGFRGVLCRTGLTGRRGEPVGEDRVDDPRVLAFSSVLAQISVNTRILSILHLKIPLVMI